VVVRMSGVSGKFDSLNTVGGIQLIAHESLGGLHDKSLYLFNSFLSLGSPAMAQSPNSTITTFKCEGTLIKESWDYDISPCPNHKSFKLKNRKELGIPATLGRLTRENGVVSRFQISAAGQEIPYYVGYGRLNDTTKIICKKSTLYTSSDDAIHCKGVSPAWGNYLERRDFLNFHYSEKLGHFVIRSAMSVEINKCQKDAQRSFRPYEFSKYELFCEKIEP
jgi:hypothetical protein